MNKSTGFSLSISKRLVCLLQADYLNVHVHALTEVVDKDWCQRIDTIVIDGVELLCDIRNAVEHHPSFYSFDAFT